MFRIISTRQDLCGGETSFLDFSSLELFPKTHLCWQEAQFPFLQNLFLSTSFFMKTNVEYLETGVILIFLPLYQSFSLSFSG